MTRLLPQGGQYCTPIGGQTSTPIDTLSFLILIGVALVAESADLHIPKGYIYFAMAFSVLVEMLNIRLRRRVAPVQLRRHIEETE